MNRVRAVRIPGGAAHRSGLSLTSVGPLCNFPWERSGSLLDPDSGLSWG